MLHLEEFHVVLSSFNLKKDYDIFDDIHYYGYFDDYLVRVINYDTIEIGVRKSFCKWGNSVDFILPYKVIRNPYHVFILHELIKLLIKENNYNASWSEAIELYPKFRKLKKTLKAMECFFRQKPLGEEFSKILHDNLWRLMEN